MVRIDSNIQMTFFQKKKQNPNAFESAQKKHENQNYIRIIRICLNFFMILKKVNQLDII